MKKPGRFSETIGLILSARTLSSTSKSISRVHGVLIDNDDNGYRVRLTELDEQQLPEGDVTVRVSHSGMNYKDALAITGNGKIVRDFPMVPGIDFVGQVEHSEHSDGAADYSEGDWVILNGWGVGEGHWGGLAQKARVNGNWLVPLPDNFSPAQAMSIGTAATQPCCA